MVARSKEDLHMPAFGENLRREREMRGVSLEEIAAATKISLRFLEAIEREDFSKLPGGIFSRSFIRSYARCLGLDEERVLAEYQMSAHPQEDFDLHRLSAGNATSGRQASRTPLIATLVALALLAGGYALFRYVPRTAEVPASTPPTPVATPPPSPAPTAPAPAGLGTTTTAPAVNPGGVSAAPGAAAPSPPGATPSTTPGTTPGTPGSVTIAPGTPPGSAATTPSAATGSTPNPKVPAAATPSAATPTPQTGSTSPVKPLGEGDLVLQVAATDRAWVRVKADGNTLLERVMTPNEVRTVRAHEAFDFTTGNAQAVILTLNGETLKPLGRRGEVKSLHLTLDTLKNSAP